MGILVFSIASSCKKDYTCKCNVKIYVKGGLYDYDRDTIKATRRTADKHCASYNLKANRDGTDSVVCYAYTNNYK